MNNKIIISLFSYCMFSAINLYCSDEIQLKELKDNLLKQEYFLSDLGKKITEQEDLIFSIKRINELFKEHIDYRKNDLGEIDDKKLAELNESFSQEYKNFVNIFFDDSKKQEQLKLMLEFHADQPISHKAILKFNIMKRNFAIHALIRLMGQWQEGSKNIEILEKQIELIEN